MTSSNLLKFFLVIFLCASAMAAAAESTVLETYPLVAGESRLEISILDAFPSPNFEGLPGQAAILFEVDSGIILFASHPDLTIPPASLTKIMTIHLSLEAAEERGIDLEDQIHYSPAAYAENAPPHSSLMFLGPGQLTSLQELLWGLAVSSGNDAAVAAAEFAAGSVSAFTGLMNQEAQRFGLRSTYFEEPSGYSAYNQTTASDLARFISYYLRRWDGVWQPIHSLPAFTYPKREDLEPGAESRFLGITQPNRNGLALSYPGADGLKNGFIDESGYNIAFTAARNGMRLAGLILGVQAPSTAAGSRLREEAAAALLDYGFRNFEKRAVRIPAVENIRVWKASPGNISLPASDLSLPVPIGAGEIDAIVEVPDSLLGPIEAGSELGRYVLGGSEAAYFSLPVRAQEAAEEAGVLRKIWDSILLFFRGLFGYPEPVQLAGH